MQKTSSRMRKSRRDLFLVIAQGHGNNSFLGKCSSVQHVKRIPASISGLRERKITNENPMRTIIFKNVSRNIEAEMIKKTFSFSPKGRCSHKKGHKALLTERRLFAANINTPYLSIRTSRNKS